MNKKFLSAILFGAMLATSAGTFVSCKDYDDDIKGLQTQIDTNKNAIAELQKLVGAGNWVTSVAASGENLVVTMSNGTTATIAGIKGADGKDGVDGKNAAEWTISEDGFWCKDGEKTTNVAVAKDGKNGLTAPSPKIENGVWVVYSWDATKGEFVEEVTEISAAGTSSFVVLKNGVYTLNIADENGEMVEISLPATCESFVVNAISLQEFGAQFSYGEWKTPTTKTDKEIFDKLAAEFPALKEYKDKDLVTQGNKIPFIVSPANMEFTEIHTFALVDSKGNDSGATLSNPTAGMPEELPLISSSRAAEGSSVWSVEYLPALNKKGTDYVSSKEGVLYSLVVTGANGVASATPFAYSYTATEASGALDLSEGNGDITKLYNEEGIDIFASVEGDEEKITLPTDVLKGMFILEATDPAQVEEYGISIEGSVVTIADMPKGKSLDEVIELKLTAISVNGSVDEFEFKLGATNEIAATGALADMEVVLTGKLNKKGEYAGAEQTIYWSLEELDLSALQMKNFVQATKTLTVKNVDVENAPSIVTLVNELYDADKKKTTDYTKVAYIAGTIKVSQERTIPGDYEVVLTASNANGVILKAESDLTLVNPEVEDLLPIKESYLDEDGVALALASKVNGKFEFDLDELFNLNYGIEIASYEDLDYEYDTELGAWLKTTGRHNSINKATLGVTNEDEEYVASEHVDQVRTIKVTYNLFGNAKNQLEKEIKVKWTSPIYAEDATDVISMTAAKLKIKFDDTTPSTKVNQIDFKAITTARYAVGPNAGKTYNLFGTAASGGGSKYYWVNYEDYDFEKEGNITYPLTSAGVPIQIAKEDLVKFGMSVSNYKKYVDLGSDAPVIYLTAEDQPINITVTEFGQYPITIQDNVAGWTAIKNAYLKYYEADKTGTGAYSLKKVYADNTNFDITKVAEYELIELFDTYKSQLVFKSVETGAVTSASGAVARYEGVYNVQVECVNEADEKYFESGLGGTNATALTLKANNSTIINVNSLPDNKVVVPMVMLITDVWGKTMTYEFNVEISK